MKKLLNMLLCNSLSGELYLIKNYTDTAGSMAQWIRRLPTEQEILGSSPGRVKVFILDIIEGGKDYTTYYLFDSGRIIGLDDNENLISTKYRKGSFLARNKRTLVMNELGQVTRVCRRFRDFCLEIP